MIMKRRLEWGRLATEPGPPGRQRSEYETLKENTAGSSRLEPLRASDGTLLYWIGINLDVEELKHANEQRRTAEEKIREQEMELRHILDLTPQLMAVFGPVASISVSTASRLTSLLVSGATDSPAQRFIPMIWRRSAFIGIVPCRLPLLSKAK